jgi:hypothetical protein
MSDRPLTGYDNIDAVSGQRDEEVYLYDALAGRLVCASCNPTGARPVGLHDQGSEAEDGPMVDRQSTWGQRWIAGNVPGWYGIGNGGGDTQHQPRYLSDSGRLFFDSSDSLVPKDTNGREDAYEYEPTGVGGCTSASTTFGERSQGCVSLISSGTSAAESAFMDASETGDDVFFVTASKLTAEDYDDSTDVYDAHVCSASVPCHVAPVSPPACTSGDSCKAAPSPQPALFGAPASATFSGAGNVIPETKKGAAKPKAKPLRCKRGFTKKHNKCVKKPTSRKTKAKKPSNHRGAKR